MRPASRTGSFFRFSPTRAFRCSLVPRFRARRCGSAPSRWILYKDYFRSEPSTGYETLIYDAMIGDATLFQRADNIEAGWRAVQPALDAWSSGAPMATYPAGSAGPKEADDLLAHDGRAWRPL